MGRVHGGAGCLRVQRYWSQWPGVGARMRARWPVAGFLAGAGSAPSRRPCRCKPVATPGGGFRRCASRPPLSGSVAGPKLSFAVDFSGAAGLSNAVLGLAHGNQIEGQAQPQDLNGRAFAGHGGEVRATITAWSAVRVAP